MLVHMRAKWLTRNTPSEHPHHFAETDNRCVDCGLTPDEARRECPVCHDSIRANWLGVHLAYDHGITPRARKKTVA